MNNNKLVTLYTQESFKGVVDISDPIAVGLINQRSDGNERQEFLNQAVVIGVRILDSTSLHLDSKTVKDEFNDLLANAQRTLGSTTDQLVEKLNLKLALTNSDSPLAKVHDLLNDFKKSFSKDMQKTVEDVKSELTMDDDEASLAKLMKRLDDRIAILFDNQSKHLEKVVTTVQAIQLKRSERTTAAGLDFQDNVLSHFQQEATNRGDIFENVSTQHGTIADSKVGDGLITLGMNTSTPDARIVIEAKRRDKSPSLKSMKAELETARQNRDAQFGIYVHAIGPKDNIIQAINRVSEKDIVVSIDENSNEAPILLSAAYTLAQALIIREEIKKNGDPIQLNKVDDAITKLTNLANTLDESAKAAKLIKSKAETIYENLSFGSSTLRSQIADLTSHLVSLKNMK